MVYKDKVYRSVSVEREERIEVPTELVKLVKGNDPEWGRNGHHWLGCERGKGKVIDRLQSYITDYNQEYRYRPDIHRYPIQLDEKGMNETRHWDASMLTGA